MNKIYSSEKIQPCAIKETDQSYRTILPVGYKKTCACKPNYLNCLTAKEWLKSQIGVWQFSYIGRDIRNKNLHPATFPISLSQKIISLFSHEGELILVKEQIGLGELDPQPYWGFNDLFHKAATKLHNCFFVVADVRRDKVTKRQKFHYNKLLILRELDLDKFVQAIEEGDLLVDFDARTGHNHGTKFRMRQKRLPELYKFVEQVF